MSMFYAPLKDGRYYYGHLPSRDPEYHVLTKKFDILAPDFNKVKTTQKEMFTTWTRLLKKGIFFDNKHWFNIHNDILKLMGIISLSNPLLLKKIDTFMESIVFNNPSERVLIGMNVCLRNTENIDDVMKLFLKHFITKPLYWDMFILKLDPIYIGKFIELSNKQFLCLHGKILDTITLYSKVHSNEYQSYTTSVAKIKQIIDMLEDSKHFVCEHCKLDNDYNIIDTLLSNKDYEYAIRYIKLRKNAIYGLEVSFVNIPFYVVKSLLFFGINSEGDEPTKISLKILKEKRKQYNLIRRMLSSYDEYVISLINNQVGFNPFL